MPNDNDKTKSAKAPVKSVKIGYSKFDLIPQPKTWVKKNKAVGQIDVDKMVIDYSSDHPTEEELANTILHEILHGIAHMFSLDFDGEREEERFVNGFANGLCMVFKDNPELAHWITDKLSKED